MCQLTFVESLKDSVAAGHGRSYFFVVADAVTPEVVL